MTLLLALALFAADPHSLAGLWTARRDFGPAVRGTLIVTSGGVATIAGRSAPVSQSGNTVAFALPNGEGRFRGRRHGDRIEGHWIQPAGVSIGEYATPVTLAKNDHGQWTGSVTPIDDHLTFFLPVTAAADGTLNAFLRNPERNAGRFMDVQHLAVDGSHVRLLGAGNSVQAEGTYDAGGEVMSIPLRGGTYDFHRATAAETAAFEGGGKIAYRRPLWRDDGWPVASVDDVGIAREAIEQFLTFIANTADDSVHASDVHAFLLARHGKLVVEQYFHGTSPDEPHDTRSASKTLATMMAGAAKIDPKTPVYATMYGARAAAAVDPRKAAITLADLLTMSSGLDCDDRDPRSPGNEDTMQDQETQPDWYRYALDLKMIRNPGEAAVYCSANANLAGGIIGKETHEWLPDLFRRRIAEPLQIRRYGLNLTPSGEAYTGGGARFLPRDFMKLGQVMLDGGRWHGRPIVSASWAKRSTSPLVELQGMHFGYLWWVTEYPWHGRTVRAFFAGGNGGQIVMGIPALDVVIAFYGGNYSDATMYLPQREFVPRLLGSGL